MAKKKKSNLAATAAAEVLMRASAAAIHNIRGGIRKQSVDGAIEIGRLLSVVREQVPYGDWLRWLKEEFDWTDRHARNFVNVYRLTQRPDRLEIISNLRISPTALYLLAAPRTPDKVRDAVLARAAAGEKVSVAEVGEAIAASGADDQPSAATDQDQAQSVDPEMDATLAKRAEHTGSSASQTTRSQRHTNARRNYTKLLKLLKPEELYEELTAFSMTITHLGLGLKISVEFAENDIAGQPERKTLQ
jgi:hypothetical protein